MANAQHSAESGEWYTPPEWVECVRSALGSIEFDPCSSLAADKVIKAGCWSDEGLMHAWHNFKTLFVNPPGSCPKAEGGLLGDYFSVCGNKTRCSCKLPKQFMERSIKAAAKGSDVIYLAYSVNQLRMLANMEIPSNVSVTIALPKERIAYLNPETMEPQRGTNCDSAFILFTQYGRVTPKISFIVQFGYGMGCLVLGRTF